MRTPVKETSTNQLNKKTELSKCPVTFTLDKIGGRWKPIILYHLMSGTKRYSDLRRAIPPVSEKMLIQQIGELEEHRLVVRKVYPVVPPHVEYSLSNRKEAGTDPGSYGPMGPEKPIVVFPISVWHIRHLR
jgi:DNA-binding HxlR family transcriptional regulator